MLSAVIITLFLLELFMIGTTYQGEVAKSENLYAFNNRLKRFLMNS